MSVTGKVDGLYVDFDLTFWDWSRLCKWLGQQSDDPTLDVFASLCMANIDLPSDDVHKAIAAARALNPPEPYDILINTIEHNVMDTAEHSTDDDLADDDDEPPTDPAGSAAPER